ncbi:MAG: tripartite tricarboxylate transporter substrate binding protein [Proteobacteria bacterium]|jgi:tripartite-type tricarboxylate transporter receptor subunit TctC|nr:tripartite tricarboxylate transporter substrate binding protein [Pseudomonadota bacterium]
MKNFLSSLLALVLCVLTLNAQAQYADYPNKPVTLVIPTGAGGGTDLVARVLQNKLSTELGQPLVIDNRAGAGGIIGNQYVARAAPDGYTLLMSSNQMAIISAVNKSTPYDPIRDFQPLAYVGLIPTVVVANAKLPVSSMQEVVAMARANPNALQYGSAGNGSPNHLFGELFKSMANVEVLHVPYKGIAAALTDVAGGTVSLSFASLPTVQGFLSSGQLKPLAVTSGRRLPALPNVPALAEVVPGYSADIWLGIWAVAKTPQPILRKLTVAMRATLQDAGVQKKLKELGLVLEPMTAVEFEALANAELVKWAKVVDDSKGAIERQ